jgi:hypothetical protein
MRKSPVHRQPRGAEGFDIGFEPGRVGADLKSWPMSRW